MGENSAIEWTTHTFNPWIGCTRVSPGCVHCYAETLMADRYGKVEWGPKGERKRTAPANWKKPLAWNRAAEKAGERARVFCASLADVFDPHPSILPHWRLELFTIMEGTPWLDWQVLTKRPENVLDMVPWHWTQSFPPNVWIGTSVEDQRRADERIAHLVRIPASVRFLSVEPLLDAVSFRWLPAFPENAPHTAQKPDGMTDHLDGLRRIQWVIVGGESGPGARPFDIAWARTIIDQCREAQVAVFVKQLGAVPTMDGQPAPVMIRDKKGGDMAGWPADLRVREMPA